MGQPLVKVLTDPRQIQSLAQPLRAELLEALREPNSAAGVARSLGKTRQLVNYHLKELERAGLVRRMGERRRGNFLEQLFQSVARRFVVAHDFTWDADRLSAALADQVSLAQLSSLGGRLQHDAAALLDRAAFEGEQIPSASIEAEVRFEDEAARTAFLRDYVQLLTDLLQRHGRGHGDPFRVVMATFPALEEPQ